VSDENFSQSDFQSQSDSLDAATTSSHATN